MYRKWYGCMCTRKSWMIHCCCCCCCGYVLWIYIYIYICIIYIYIYIFIELSLYFKISILILHYRSVCVCGGGCAYIETETGKGWKDESGVALCRESGLKLTIRLNTFMDVGHVGCPVVLQDAQSILEWILIIIVWSSLASGPPMNMVWSSQNLDLVSHASRYSGEFVI